MQRIGQSVVNVLRTGKAAAMRGAGTARDSGRSSRTLRSSLGEDLTLDRSDTLLWFRGLEVSSDVRRAEASTELTAELELGEDFAAAPEPIGGLEDLQQTVSFDVARTITRLATEKAATFDASFIDPDRATMRIITPRGSEAKTAGQKRVSFGIASTVEVLPERRVNYSYPTPRQNRMRLSSDSVTVSSGCVHSHDL